MRQVLLGGEGGIPVSALCLGVMTFGTTVDETTAFAILDAYAEAGGTFVDTSNNYACWVEGATGDESELLLGRWLASRGLRDRMTVATKVGARPDPARGPSWPSNTEGLAPAVVRSAIEGSLRRLGTDHVDLYFAHVMDPATPLEETVAAFSGLVDDGRTRMAGCGNHPSRLVREARRIAAEQGLAPYRVVRQRHSYLRPRPEADFGVQEHVDGHLLDYVGKQPDLSLVGYATLAGGVYSRPEVPLPEHYDRPEAPEALTVVREVAASLGATPEQVVLSWLLDGDPPVTPILEVDSVARLHECLAAADLHLPDPLRGRLDNAV